MNQSLLLLLPQRYKFSSKSQRLVGNKWIWASCCCYRKGTNFQANHNAATDEAILLKLLLLPQRYKFSSKSQHPAPAVSSLTSCCCYRKGTNFQANHNIYSFRHFIYLLLLLPQRYKFSSKSQRTSRTPETSGSCCCYRKGTNFQANHNRLLNIW